MDALPRLARVQHAPPMDRIELLLREMTVAEKVGQMTQYAFFERQAEQPAELERLLGDVRRGSVGSFLNVKNKQHRDLLQRAAVEESRLGIPLIFGRDVIHGYETIFPIPLGLAASFEPRLAEAAAHAAAREARAAGIDWTFAPMVDVTREPRWGRVAEGFGEDPLLAARFGAATVRGFQGDDPSAPGRIGACAKHYLAYGAVEAGKEYNTTWVPERLLRDVYLPPFRACVEAGVVSVMCGFNDLNGVPMSAHRWALRDLLKGELAFEGFVVTDWASTHEMILHGICADDREAARESARAGIDMEMASKAYQSELARLVEAGEVSCRDLDEAVRRILSAKQRLGLFARPYTGAEPVESSVTLSRPHLDLAREAARSSLVLLQNQRDCLPLSDELSSLCVVGPLADDVHNPLGCWAFDGDRSKSVTLYAALRERLGASVRLTHALGLPECRSFDPSGFDAARDAVADADVAIVVLGEDANISGECRSRAFLELPGAQTALLEELATTGTPLVLVVMAGRPLVLEREAGLAHAVLCAWHPGSMAGPAIADVLFGDVAPSGKLPITFPRAVGQVPIYYNHKNTGRPPRRTTRGIPLGNPLDPVDMDASYLDVEVSPQFPFGFGLSYTRFEFSDVRVSPERGGLDATFEISALVRNAGERAGVEVAQLYVRDCVGSVTRPVRELKGFERVALEPGQTERVVFRLAASELAFCDRELRVRAEPGRFEAYVGGDSRAEARAEFELVSH